LRECMQADNEKRKKIAADAGIKPE